ncbi:F-box and leucine-rich protein 22 [Salvelinus sp. IW2-2015]|uniref:F-box and leucine-rich protein 22 n=1 Tax=Salvelinus sp. IW2-2015 TaxID=2691554 RepID=UPI000CEB19E7|nr:F-box and leucine-rich protein 22 [Salvelinus alpinus]
MQPSTMDASTTKLIQPTTDLTITQLNQECLLHLLSYLDKDSCRSFSLTCHRLREVYLDPRLWSLLLFRSPSELRRENYVLGPSLRYLAVTWHSTRVKVCNIEDWMKNQFQKDLCSKHESLVSSFLERVCTMCPNLLSLTLSGCGHISDQEVICVLQSCSRLRSLRLENCVRVTDLTLQALVLHGAGLHQVTVDFCRNVTQAGLETVRERRPDIRLTAERSAGMIPDSKPDKRTQLPLRRRLMQKVLMFS